MIFLSVMVSTRHMYLRIPKRRVIDEIINWLKAYIAKQSLDGNRREMILTDRQTVRKRLHPIIKKIVLGQPRPKLSILNDMPKFYGNAIYVSNHSCKYDSIVATLSVGKPVYFLVGRQHLILMDRLFLIMNGVVWVDRKNKRDKRNAKNKIVDLLKRGEDVFMFPEGTWNFTPSKPLLPLYWGCIDIAKETSCPIIPMVFDYQEDACFVKYGQPYFIGGTDKSKEIENVETAMATLLWEIWESMPVTHRGNVKDDYWDNEFDRRLKEYPMINPEYERSCARKRI